MLSSSFGFRKIAAAIVNQDTRRCIHHSAAVYASRGSRKERQERRGHRTPRSENNKTVVGGENMDGIPSFKTLTRQIYRKMHPDLLQHDYPEYSRVNDDSLQTLNSILTSIKKFGEYPPQIVKTLPFHMLVEDDTTGRGTKLVNLRIQTAGGECKRQLTTSFVAFFHQTDTLPKNFSTFKWDAEYFPTEAPSITDGDDDNNDEEYTRKDSVIQV